MFESQLMQTSGPREEHRHLQARPPDIFCFAKSPGAGHTFQCESPGVQGGSDQSDTCISIKQDSYSPNPNSTCRNICCDVHRALNECSEVRSPINVGTSISRMTRALGSSDLRFMPLQINHYWMKLISHKPL